MATDIAARDDYHDDEDDAHMVTQPVHLVTDEDAGCALGVTIFRCTLQLIAQALHGTMANPSMRASSSATHQQGGSGNATASARSVPSSSGMVRI